MSNLVKIKETIESDLNISDILARQILSNLAIILDTMKITFDKILEVSFSENKTHMTISSRERNIEILISGTSLTVLQIITPKKAA